jgi:hypothetical protein
VASWQKAVKVEAKEDVRLKDEEVSSPDAEEEAHIEPAYEEELELLVEGAGNIRENCW